MNPNPMADQVGPVYTETAILNVTGWDRAMLDAEMQASRVLALRTSDDRWAYPVFQFTDGTINPRVRKLLDIFRAVDPSWWTVASWFAAPKEDLNGTTAADWANTNQDMVPVLRLAHLAARRWAA